MNKTVIYQILPRLWGNSSTINDRDGSLEENGCGKFREIDDCTLVYLRDELHVSYIWLTGVLRHATTASFEGCPDSNPRIVKGRAGSPYAIVDYYDVNPYLADNPSNRLCEFKALLKRIHNAGLKVVMDFIPNHVSRDYGKVGLVRDDIPALGSSDDCSVHWKPENDFFYYPGQPLLLPAPIDRFVSGVVPYYENPAKASGNRFSPSPGFNDWYETIRLNYCDFHTSTWDKMLDIVRYWCSEGIDCFRCDMVEMVPWQFMKWLIDGIKKEFPEVTFIAEVYGKDLYRHYVETVGFDLLYDKSGLYDILRSVVEGKGSARGITWNWQMLGDLQPRMLNFLENHDEQRFASSFFGNDPSRSFAPLAASLFLNEAPFMIYFGEEIGEPGMDAEGFSGRDGRTTIFDWWSVPSLRRLNEYIHAGKGLTDKESETLGRWKDALSLASRPAVSSGKTFDLNYCNAGSGGFDPDKHFAFLRGDGEETLLIVCNFSGEDSVIDIFIPEEATCFLGMKKTEAFRVNVSVKQSDYAVLPV